MKAFLRGVLLLPVAVVMGYVRLLKRARKGVGYAAQARLDTLSEDSWTEVVHQSDGEDVRLRFLSPNALCDFRVSTFSTKEPETLEWIDQFGGGGTLYDVGANVGLYSVYYAKRHPGQVVAFEPSVFNLALLARNIAANGVGDRVTIIPLPLTSTEEVAQFRLTSTDLGGALSSFAEDIGYDGKPFDAVFSYSTLGTSLDFLVREQLIAQPPTLIKIDVDGIEHLVLRGAVEVLSDPGLVSVLIEVNDSVPEVAGPVASILGSHGFHLSETRHGDLFTGTRFGSIGNQIWVRT